LGFATQGRRDERADADSVRARLFVALQYLLPHHFLSRLAYRITRSRVPLVKNALIRSFVSNFHPT